MAENNSWLENWKKRWKDLHVNNHSSPSSPSLSSSHSDSHIFDEICDNWQCKDCHPPIPLENEEEIIFAPAIVSSRNGSMADSPPIPPSPLSSDLSSVFSFGEEAELERSSTSGYHSSSFAIPISESDSYNSNNSTSTQLDDAYDSVSLFSMLQFLKTNFYLHLFLLSIYLCPH